MENLLMRTTAVTEKSHSSAWLRRFKTRARVAACSAGVYLLAGCSSALLAPAPKPVKPTVVTASLQAAANANPDLQKRPSPLMVRVFELKSLAAFEAADFLSLYDRDQAVLTTELAGREEIVLRPGETRPWEKNVGPEVRFIGVTAAFRDIERARWKALVAIKPNVKNQITIKADNISLSASVANEVKP
jgi:type VI secretion system protein VasD